MANNRRYFLLSATAALASPHVTPARAQAAPLRIGFISPTPPTDTATFPAVLHTWLANKGAKEGRDYVIDAVYGDGNLADLPKRVADLAARAPAVVMTAYPLAVLRGVPKVPVVVLGATPNLPQRMADEGFAGRVTGVDFNTGAFDVLRLGTLAELLPARAKVVGLVHPVVRDNPRLDGVRAEAARLGLDYQIQFVSTPADIEAALAQAKAAGAQAVQQLANQVTHSQRSHIIAHAQHQRLPAIYEWPETAREGGLIALGNDRVESWNRLMHQAWHLAQGGALSEVPVVPASEPRLAVNRRTAQALALTVPNIVMQRAHEVIG